MVIRRWERAVQYGTDVIATILEEEQKWAGIQTVQNLRRVLRRYFLDDSSEEVGHRHLVTHRIVLDRRDRCLRETPKRIVFCHSRNILFFFISINGEDNAGFFHSPFRVVRVVGLREVRIDRVWLRTLRFPAVRHAPLFPLRGIEGEELGILRREVGEEGCHTLEGSCDTDENFGEETEEHGFGERVEEGIEEYEGVELDFGALGGVSVSMNVSVK